MEARVHFGFLRAGLNITANSVNCLGAEMLRPAVNMQSVLCYF